MNAKERVSTALRRTGTPDRVPVQFDLCRQLLEAFSEKCGIPVDYTPSYYEDLMYRISGNALRTAMGSDCVIVGGSLPAGYEPRRTADGCVVNEFGMVMRQGPLYMEVIEAPLAGVSSVDEIERFPFPDPLAAGRYDDAERLIAEYGDDYFVIGDLELTAFEMAWHMVGLEKFMIDMAMGEPYIDALLDRTMAFSVGVGRRLVELGVDGIWAGDDFGAQHGMLLSPRTWRQLFKPRYAELFAELKAANPDVTIMYHSDGAVAPILGDLIEIGMEVFNPVQPNVPGHEPEALKAQYGDQLSFWGAIDQQHLLPDGTPQEIERDVEEKIRVLGAGGGYMCAPAHIIQADTSPANVEAFIAAVRKHGVYA
ncbi:MAG: uroporphyrinogen decarboxylase family protein [Anaerolineae bacterium]